MKISIIRFALLSALASSSVYFGAGFASALAALPPIVSSLVNYGEASRTYFELDKPLRVSTWNLHKFDNRKTYGEFQELAESSDIVLAQETLLSMNKGEYFAGVDGMQWSGAISFFVNREEGTGVMTGQRVKPLREEYIVSRAREPVTNTPKMILLTEYAIKDSKETLLAANIHAINFVSDRVYFTQLRQLEEALKKHSGPMVLAGDFNNHTIGRALAIRHMAERLGLLYLEMDNQFRRLRIDHIFIRGLVKSVAIIRSDLKSSDHWPLQTTLYFESTKADK